MMNKCNSSSNNNKCIIIIHVMSKVEVSDQTNHLLFIIINIIDMNILILYYNLQ